LKRKAIFLLYRVLQALASPILLVYLVVRGLRNPKYFPTLGERCGTIPSSWQQTVSGSIWLHAVSVGEIIAAVPLIEEIRKRLPETPVFVSTSTLAGRETAEKRLTGLTAGVFFVALDYVWAVRRVLRRLRPSVVVILETEIWPNLFREAKRVGCGLVIVNGRISDRALPRYQRFAPLFAEVLAMCDNILAQSDEMKGRFEAAGAPGGRVKVGGNLKYDFTPSALQAGSSALAFIEAHLTDANPGQPLWIAASTSADDRISEEDFVIAAQQELRGWVLIIAPRNPQRFDGVADLLDRSGLNWTRGSTFGNPHADVLLLDSIGELSALFAHATVVFMGGTLADRGGHNILEPAIFGKPVIVGPHMENFREIAEDFERRQAFLRIDSGSQLHAAVMSAASEPGLGDRARAAAERNRGAAARAADEVLALYETGYPCERDAQPAYALLWLLSLLWQAGSARDQRAKSGRTVRLPVPVVSVGNITTGGTGKTPVTIELLREFRGMNAGLLTRGHGRAAREGVVFLEGDENITLALSGDEAQLCMRQARIPIGIGPDRHAMGMQLLREVHLRVLFLDDGFQHLQLHRDFDLVLIDSLRPFGGGHLVPLGRLREPLDGLARASAFLITRADEVPTGRAIESVLRRYNAPAPIFHARTVPANWRDAAGVEFELDLFKNSRAVAFCGLGNPQAFWKTLRRLNIEPLACYEYEDHHQYTPSEIRRLAQHARDLGADMLLTTAKDAVNLAADYAAIMGKVKLYWLEIRTEIDRREELFGLIRQKCF
jgi:tetraacyldisaccharide 4'-kinase